MRHAVENEANVRHILVKYAYCLNLIKVDPQIGGPGLVGKHPSGGIQARLEKTTADGGSLSGTPVLEEVWLTESESSLCQRFDPTGAQDTMGFFIAAFEKTSSVQHA